MFTYSVPEGMEGCVVFGKRVLVPLGKSKKYIAMVVKVHQEKPSFKVKPIEQVLDATPTLLDRQYRLWSWISNYYMSPLGDVYNAAMPAGMKSAEKFKPRMELYVELTSKYRNEASLHVALNMLQRALKQSKALATFLSLSHWDSLENDTPREGIKKVTKEELMNEAHCTSAIVKSLIDRDILFTYEEEVGRLNTSGESHFEQIKPLSIAQQEAYNKILLQMMKKNVVLLHGVTSSGKTEVYIHLIKQALDNHKQVLYLLPEIALTVQIMERLHKVFGDRLGIYHSKYSDAERVEIWQKQMSAHPYDVILGARSAVFLPFQNLGLVIIDEEQRFGVKHKEKLKENFIGVDMLTLSATPIPRTLNMAMSGIRDLSTIEQPPIERQPVETFVLEYNDVILAEAMKKELARGGQVYCLHNRVDNIESTAAHVSQLVPGARVGIAHGKMTEEELNPVWQHLLNGEIDILVCTTLIETGIDVRNCNTLIIEDADRMGLAQLYQIRGRVGRSGRKAYAYFTFRRDKTLTDIAQKRLSAIREFTAFGSGFRIAMRDLQIRGAGSLLGHSQHGHMEAVGYDLYVKMLGQAISRARGEPVQRDKSDCLVDLRVDAFIPEKYIPDGAGRIEAYKRIAAIQTPEDAADVLDELIDRYGDPPPSVSDLVNVSLVRVQAAAVGVYEVTQKKDTLVLNLETLELAMIRGLLQAFNGRVTAGAGSKPYLSVVLQPDEKPLELLQSILKAMDAILNNKEPNQ